MAKVYELKINPEQNFDVDAIALVEQPAIEETFMAFSKAKERFRFAINEEKKELIGAAMIPDIKIPCLDANNEVFEVFFSTSTIRQIAQNYFKKGYQANTNIEHTSTPADSYVFQSFIVDNEKGIMSPKGMDLPDGSWVVGVKVENEKVWQGIKDGKFKGFSVEGFFQQVEQAFSKQITPLDELKAINERLSNMK